MRLARVTRFPLLLALLLASLVLGLGTAPAGAVGPLVLSGQVTDQVGVLDDSRSAIVSEFAQVEAEHDVRMWVVFVASFDGMDPQAWTDATFRATGLADRDYLLAVARGDRKYGYVVSDAFPLNDAALARVAAAARNHLAEYPDLAVLAAAAEMTDELAWKAGSGAHRWGDAPGSDRTSEDSARYPTGAVAVMILTVGAVILSPLLIRDVRQGLVEVARAIGGPTTGDSSGWGTGDSSGWGTGDSSGWGSEHSESDSDRGGGSSSDTRGGGGSY